MNHAILLVDFKAWMQRQYSHIGVCIRWEPVQVEAVRSILNTINQRFELLALEWVTVATVIESNNDTRILDARNRESGV
jgi:hypothetical protein